MRKKYVRNVGMHSFSRNCQQVNCYHSLSLKAGIAFEDQRANIKFWRHLEKSLTETLYVLQQLYGERAIFHSNVLPKTLSHVRLRKIEMATMKTVSFQIAKKFSATVLDHPENCIDSEGVCFDGSCVYFFYLYDINKSYSLGNPVLQSFWDW